MNALLKSEIDTLYEPERIPEEFTETFEPFRIKNLDEASWAFRKINALQSKKREVETLASEEILRINIWLQKEKGTVEQDIEFFESLLKQYFITEKEKDIEFKLSTPYGKVTSRNEVKWSYDEETVLKNLKQAGLNDYIKVTESLNKTALKGATKYNGFILTDDGKVATSDGEIIEGLTLANELKICIKTE